MSEERMEFKQKSTLLQHGCIQIESRPYPCSECGKCFRQKSHLTQHLRIHTNEKPYACIYCGRRFRQQSHLTKHLRIHTGEKPYRREQCGKVFRQKAILDQHTRTHQGERPYCCPLLNSNEIGEPKLSNMVMECHEKTIAAQVTTDQCHSTESERATTLSTAIIDERVILKNSLDKSLNKSLNGSCDNNEPTCKKPRLDVNQVSHVDSDDENADDPAPGSPQVISDQTDTRQTNATEINKDSTAHRLFLKNFRTDTFAQFSRSDLEELIVQKICESITERAVTGELRRRTDMLEGELLMWKTRALACQKQAREMKEIVEKCVKDLNARANVLPTPLRVNRSVGLQVSFNSLNNQKKSLPVTPVRPNSELVEMRMGSSPKTSGQIKITPKNAQYQPIRPKPACKIMPFYATASPAPKILITQSPKTVNGSAEPLPAGVIDLTDDEPAKSAHTNPTSTPKPNIITKPTSSVAPMVHKSTPMPLTQIPSANSNSNTKTATHPAPLPATPPLGESDPSWKLPPSRPTLKISNSTAGIVLLWDIDKGPDYEPVPKYEIYAYQETDKPPRKNLWSVVGEVKALCLPIACTLSSFVTGYRYHLAVRGVDIRGRVGPFSLPGSVFLRNPTEETKKPINRTGDTRP